MSRFTLCHADASPHTCPGSCAVRTGQQHGEGRARRRRVRQRPGERLVCAIRGEDRSLEAGRRAEPLRDGGGARAHQRTQVGHSASLADALDQQICHPLCSLDDGPAPTFASPRSRPSRRVERCISSEKWRSRPDGQQRSVVSMDAKCRAVLSDDRYSDAARSAMCA